MSYRIRERIQIQVWKRYRTTPHNEPGTPVTLHASWSLEYNVFDVFSLQTENREKVKLIIQEIIIEKCQNCLLTQTFRVYNPSSVWKILVIFHTEERLYTQKEERASSSCDLSMLRFGGYLS